MEIPWLSPGGSAAGYLETLERLRGLLSGVEHVVPGHGGPLEPANALRILEEDVAYLQAVMSSPEDVTLPAGRDTGAQRKIHAENLERVLPTRR